MSKKIKIPSDNIKFRLVDLFHSFIERKHKSEKYTTVYDDDMDDEELMWLMQQQGFIFRDVGDDFANYYCDDDGGDVIWPPASQSKKGKKNGVRTADDIYKDFWDKESRKSKRKHRKGKHARLINLNEPYSGEEEYPNDEINFSSYEELDDDNGILDGKEIYYYPDYHDKENRLEFSTLKAFQDFCDDNGYVVPEYVGNAIMYRRVSHTCLIPQSREYGMYEIMAEESYGNMFYEVCDASELNG